MVEQPERVDAGQAALAALLPVDPPEVDALRFERPVQLVEVRLQEPPVGGVERDRLSGRRVDPHRLGHRGVGVLERADAVGGVQVERGAHPPPVQLGQEGPWVGEQRRLPRVAGPAVAELRRHGVDAVPVHVDDRDRERQAFLGEPVHELQVRRVAVRVVAAPPVAERPPGQACGCTGHLVEGAECGVEVTAVREHRDVAAAGHAGADPAVVLEQERLAVVEHGDAVAGQDAGFERHPSVDVVQGAAGTAEVAGLLSPAPAVRVGADGLDDQAARAERTAVVAEPGPFGRDDDAAGAASALDCGTDALRRERRHRHPSPDRERRGTVLEPAVVAPLDAERAGVQDGDPPVLAGDDGSGVGHRVGSGERPDRRQCGLGHGHVVPLSS